MPLTQGEMKQAAKAVNDLAKQAQGRGITIQQALKKGSDTVGKPIEGTQIGQLLFRAKVALYTLEGGEERYYHASHKPSSPSIVRGKKPKAGTESAGSDNPEQLAHALTIEKADDDTYRITFRSEDGSVSFKAIAKKVIITLGTLLLGGYILSLFL